MANEVFKDCKNMEKAVFAEGFSLPIPKYTFWNCTKLADVTLSSTTEVIGLNAFENCDSLKTIELPEGITFISAYAFANCKTLNRITLPATLSMIGNKAFTGCGALTQITVTAIKGGAFRSNTKLTTVTIDNSVKTIGDEAFKGCSALATVTMPATLDSIGQQAFANTAITNVTVPYAPKMGKEIFYWCTKLSNISFSTSLTTLPERTFQGCLSLKDVTIPSQITSIGDYAFAGCNTISSLTLSANIKKLGDYAFYDVFGNGDELVIEATTLPTASENTFDEEAYKNALLKTTASTTAAPWKNFSNVEGSSSEQCKAPTIEYAGGKLKFSSATTGATIVSTISIADSGENTENEVVLSKNYVVTAYAKKDGYRRSETVTKNFQFTNGDVNLDGKINITDSVLIVNKIVGKVDALALSIIALLAMSAGAMAQNALTVTDILLPQTGEATLTVNYQFDAADTYTAYQFNLELPSDLEFVMKEGTDAQLVKGECHDDSHSVTANLDGDLLKVAALSGGSKPLKGTSGILLQFTVRPKTNALTIGTEYNCAIKDITITTTEAAERNLDDASFKVTISKYTFLDEASTVTPAAGEGVDVLVKRTIKANEWSTICLPFAMTEAQVKAAFGDDVQLGDFNGYETEEDADENIIGITVKFNSVTAIEANHPYIIKVSTPIAEFSADGVDVAPEETPTVAAVKRTKKAWSEMTGTYTANTLIGENCLFLYNNKFYYSKGATKMKAFRGYFDFYDVLTSVEAAAPVMISFNSVATDINSVNRMATADDRLYDMQGRRVEKATKGLYIQNGKKIVVK